MIYQLTNIEAFDAETIDRVDYHDRESPFNIIDTMDGMLADAPWIIKRALEHYEMQFSLKLTYTVRRHDCLEDLYLPIFRDPIEEALKRPGHSTTMMS